MNKRERLTNYFITIALGRVDEESAIKFYNRFKYKINFNAITEIEHYGPSMTYEKVSLFYAITQEENLITLSKLMVSDYVNDSRLKEFYDLEKDSHYLTILSQHFFREDLTLLKKWIPDFNNYIIKFKRDTTDSEEFKISIFQIIIQDHSYDFKRIMKFFNPSPEQVNIIDSDGDNLLHNLSETQGYDDIDSEIELLEELIDLLTLTYKLDLNLENNYKSTPLDYMISRCHIPKHREAVFEFVMNKYKPKFNYNKAIENLSKEFVDATLNKIYKKDTILEIL